MKVKVATRSDVKLEMCSGLLYHCISAIETDVAYVGADWRHLASNVCSY